MAGEYFVAAELNRRGINATITYGNAKKVDIVAFSSDKSVFEVIEVKTTDKNEWVIGSKLPDLTNDIWILVQLPKENSPKYHIYTSEELHFAAKPRIDNYRKNYKLRHGKDAPDKGPLSHKVELAKPFLNRWDIIEERFKIIK